MFGCGSSAPEVGLIPKWRERTHHCDGLLFSEVADESTGSEGDADPLDCRGPGLRFYSTVRVGSTLVVSETLSRESIAKPLSQRCLAPMELHQEWNSRTEKVGSVVAIGALAEGLTFDQLRVAQVDAFGDPGQWIKAEGSSKYNLTTNDLLCVSPGGPGSTFCLLGPPQLVVPCSNTFIDPARLGNTTLGRLKHASGGTTGGPRRRDTSGRRLRHV